MTPKEFLIWFQGFSEATKKPSPTQWKTLVDKLMSVNLCAVEQAPAVALPPLPPLLIPQPAPVDLKPSPRSSASWQKAFKARLIEQGCDAEMAETLTAQEPVNIGMDPIMVADSAFSVE